MSKERTRQRVITGRLVRELSTTVGKNEATLSAALRFPAARVVPSLLFLRDEGRAVRIGQLWYLLKKE